MVTTWPESINLWYGKEQMVESAGEDDGRKFRYQMVSNSGRSHEIL